MSNRLINTEQPYIEDVMDKYSALPDITMLSLGSVYWDPPTDAMDSALQSARKTRMHRYGNIMGCPKLISHLTAFIASKGINMDNQALTVTAGCNQAYANAALSLCDSGDNAIVVAPYYFPHRCSLQLSNANITNCPFNAVDFGPNWDILESQIATIKPKMVVITTPNNPSGKVWSSMEIERVIALCKSVGAWLVVDQTYHEFLYDGQDHTYPCGQRFGYDRIIHLFSFSKIFGMPGWRVGYMVYPSVLADQMRKIQDNIPTHTCMLSQELALKCMERYFPLENLRKRSSSSSSSSYPALDDTRVIPSRGGDSSAAPEHEWYAQTVTTLDAHREALWPVLEPLGTVKPTGAFYYLVPVPPLVGEEEALDILARDYSVLLMWGHAFGAPGYLRLSYGNIAPGTVEQVIAKLKAGFVALQSLSETRQKRQKER